MVRNKNECEICECDISKIRHSHHIVPRVDSRSTNGTSNLAYICPSCHAKVHKHLIILEGVYNTSAGQKLFWYKEGESWTIRPGIFIQRNGTAKIVEA